MMELQRALADVVLAGSRRRRASPRSSASDGTNPTTNSGRLSITLKPRDERNVERRRDHRAPRAEARRGRRHRGLPAVGAGSADRQPRQPHAVPVHARGRRPGGARRVGAASWSTSSARRPSLEDVASDQQNAGLQASLDDRSRHRVAPRHLAAGDRRHALRRLRPAAGLDDLHAAQPVPRHPRGEARASSSDPRRSTRSTSARPTGDAGAALRVRPRGRRRRRRSRSTTRASSRRSRSRSTSRDGASLGDAVDGDPGARGARSACRRASTPSSRAPRRRSASRSRASRSSSSRRSSPSTSCSACSTRATSTRSRSSRRCRRPASARSSRSCVCRTRVQRHRAHRDHPAHRHREEERDHDDRLRARGGARRRACRRRRRSTRPACCASGRS